MRVKSAKKPALTVQATSRAQRVIYEELHKVRGWKKVSSSNVWICCPYHNETAPSFGVNIDPSNTKAALGQGYCFGCGANKHWNEIAETLGLRKLKELDFVQSHTARRDLEAEAERLFGTPVNGVGALAKGLGINLYMDFPPEQKWRTISGKVMKFVNARLVFDNYSKDNAVLLPCYVDDELVGGIKALIERDETSKRKQIAYITSSDNWVKKHGLYPYDAAVKLMRMRKLKTIVLVEGPRDALRLIQKGIPAVAILGTNNWGLAKKNLVLSMGADVVVLMMDGDAPGRKAQANLYRSLHRSIVTKRFALSKYSSQLGTKVDPGNASGSVLKKLKDYCYSL